MVSNYILPDCTVHSNYHINFTTNDTIETMIAIIDNVIGI